MPWWLILGEEAAKMAVQVGLRAWETKHPGVHPVVDEILRLIGSEPVPLVAKPKASPVARDLAAHLLTFPPLAGSARLKQVAAAGHAA